MKEGILVVNKPNGITSHDVVDHVRRKFNMRRVGHAGTLDPLATGVLVILLGKSTKFFDKFVSLDKAYRATLILGTMTDSADIKGKVLQQNDYTQVGEDQIKKAFSKFEGEIEQVPPMVSAVKVKGKKLYELARRGIQVDRPARKITITRLEIEKIDIPNVQFYVECSKGTYVRQLAEDVGKLLGCGACISQIERVRVGAYSIDQAVTIDKINESHIQNFKD